ncbi:MAG TPA: presenilin family intramembrane aspartyl protease PSH [Candidatus Thermoplasmatota archaeon]|nr:presenilin family intramembrane aspartyl protease PSH [Candidatus Thermoplasmatota archaeon]
MPSSVEPHAPQGAATRAPVERADLVPAFFMGLLLLGSILLAMASARIYQAEVGPIFERPDDPVNAVFYLGLVIVFTFVILLVARYGFARLIRYIFLSFVLLTLVYVSQPLAAIGLRAIVGADPSLFSSAATGIVTGSNVAALVVAFLVTSLLYVHPEWWVIDVAGVAVAAGAAAIFGISFGLLPALLLLVAFALYDAIAVYRTKHMIDLADTVLDMRLPIILVVPRKRGYSFLAETKRLKESVEKEEPRDAMFMGLGDIVIPAVLVVSSLAFLPADPALLGLPGNWVVALAALAGTMAGYAVLMWFVLSGRPQAGLPSLNGGTILGFFAALLPLYGVAPLLPI